MVLPTVFSSAELKIIRFPASTGGFVSCSHEWVCAQANNAVNKYVWRKNDNPTCFGAVKKAVVNAASPWSSSKLQKNLVRF